MGSAGFIIINRSRGVDGALKRVSRGLKASRVVVCQLICTFNYWVLVKNFNSINLSL